MSIVFATFDSEREASDVVDRLKRAGFSNADISAIFPETETTRAFAEEKATRAPEAAAVGAGTGAIVGAGLGWLAGIGALALPGLGPLIAAGPIAAALSGAAIGGAVGGLAGALIGMGVPEEEAKQYEDRIRGGAILMSVHTEDTEESERARDLLVEAGSDDVRVYDDSGVRVRRGATTGGFSAPGGDQG